MMCLGFPTWDWGSAVRGTWRPRWQSGGCSRRRSTSAWWPSRARQRAPAAHRAGCIRPGAVLLACRKSMHAPHAAAVSATVWHHQWTTGCSKFTTHAGLSQRSMLLHPVNGHAVQMRGGCVVCLTWLPGKRTASPQHLAAGPTALGGRLAGAAVPGGYGQLRDGCRALLHLVPRAEGVQSALQAILLLVLQQRLVPGASV